MIWKTIVVLFVVGAAVESTSYGDMCRKNGHGDIADEVERTIANEYECLLKVLELGIAQREFIAALPTGSVSSVAQKYCPKASEIKVCIKRIDSALAPCQPQYVQDDVNAGYNITSDTIDFVCYNDGERINSFIAEGGYQCVQEKLGALRDCGSIPGSSPGYSPTSHEEACRIVTNIESCVTSALEGCSTSAAANLARSNFEIVRKAYSCPK